MKKSLYALMFTIVFSGTMSCMDLEDQDDTRDFLVEEMDYQYPDAQDSEFGDWYENDQDEYQEDEYPEEDEYDQEAGEQEFEE